MTVYNSKWYISSNTSALMCRLCGWLRLTGLLYRAPELLRMTDPPPQGTQKGDVYSFGILMYAIHGRLGPFGFTSASPNEILKKLIEYSPPLPPFRSSGCSFLSCIFLRHRLTPSLYFCLVDFILSLFFWVRLFLKFPFCCCHWGAAKSTASVDGPLGPAASSFVSSFFILLEDLLLFFIILHLI